MFLDEVRIPVSNRVGAENDGWRVTNVTLSFERGTAFVGDVRRCHASWSRAVGAAEKVTARSATAWDDRVLRSELAHIAAELDGARGR